MEPGAGAAASTAAISSSADDEEIANPYRKMLEFNVPAATVRSKMEADNCPARIIDAVLSGQPLPAARHQHEHNSSEIGANDLGTFNESVAESLNMKPPPTGAIAADPTAAISPSADNEEIANPYRRMLEFNVPPATVRSKMEADRCPAHIIDAVLSGQSSPAAQHQHGHISFEKGANDARFASTISPSANKRRRLSSLVQVPLEMMGLFSAPETAPGDNVLSEQVQTVVDEISPPADPAGALEVVEGRTVREHDDSAPLGRRSSIFNLFRRQSRALRSSLVKGHRACSSITYDTENHNKLLLEIEKDGTETEKSAGTRNVSGVKCHKASQSKRKATEDLTFATDSPPCPADRDQPPSKKAEATAAAESADGIEPADHRASFRMSQRLSFSPALLSKILSALKPASAENGAVSSEAQNEK